MKKLIAAASWAAALCLGSAAQAAVVTLNDPGEIAIDAGTNVATYTESGFALSGPAASFLTIDNSLLGGIDGTTPFSLRRVGGGAFSLASFDYAFFDLGFGAGPGTLSVTGLFNGVQVAAQTFALGSLASASFGAAFANLTGVDFSGTTGFTLDNLNVQAAAVPEPSTVVLTALGLIGVAFGARRRRSRWLATPCLWWGATSG